MRLQSTLLLLLLLLLLFHLLIPQKSNFRASTSPLPRHVVETGQMCAVQLSYPMDIIILSMQNDLSSWEEPALLLADGLRPMGTTAVTRLDMELEACRLDTCMASSLSVWQSLHSRARLIRGRVGNELGGRSSMV